MEQEKIGLFIQQMRKENGLTQKDLAEKLHISDKTVSKWETGKGLPEVSLLVPLCSILQININELLSGEKLQNTEYARQAENHILTLLKENRENKKKNVISMMIGFLFLISGFAMMFFYTYYHMSWYIDVPAFLIGACLCIACVLLSTRTAKQDVVRLLKTIVIPIGVCVSIVAFVCVMSAMEDMSMLYVELAVLALPILYALITYVILAVIEQRMRK